MHDEKYIDIIELFDNHLNKFVEDDEVIVFDDVESKDNHIDVYWIKPNLEYRPYSILVTCGMSRYPMKVPVGNDEKRFIEVAMLFPMDWDFSNIESKPETISWPISHLQSIGKMPISLDTWIGFGHTIGCNDSKGEYFPGTKFNSTIIFPSLKLPKSFTEFENGDSLVKIYSATPLYSEELKFKFENDSNALIDKFNEFNIQEIIDTNRKNTCK